MNIYLDESYNFQKNKGKQFLSINGFAVLNDKVLRKRWRQIRRQYTGRYRIHANDQRFKELRKKSSNLLSRRDLTVISVFQLIKTIPPGKNFWSEKINFEEVYLALVISALDKLELNEYRKVRLIIDARAHKGGLLGKNMFLSQLENYMLNNFIDTKSEVKLIPSHRDILLELADFASNTFYRAYQSEDFRIFDQFEINLIQIKDPLKRGS